VNGGSATRLPARRALSPSARRAVLTAHIIVSVGLLGDSAGFLAVALRGVSTGDPELADASWTLLEMFSLVFGIPLSFAAPITGSRSAWARAGGCFAIRGPPSSCSWSSP
jgi:hypothetical protein